MIAIKPQTIRSPSGEELVVLSRAEFDALTSAAAEALEDADDIAVFDERMAALKSGLDAPLPVEVSAAMLRGEGLLRALRSWKGLTQQEVATRTGLAQGYVSDLETNRKSGSEETLRALAKALEVDPKWLGVD
jgi:hypothetical protein